VQRFRPVQKISSKNHANMLSDALAFLKKIMKPKNLRLTLHFVMLLLLRRTEK